MKRLKVNINDEQYQRLQEIAKDYDVSVAEILGAFTADLTGVNSNGSDERSFAWRYLERTWIGIFRSLK
jgi:hypothetical protein